MPTVSKVADSGGPHAQMVPETSAPGGYSFPFGPAPEPPPSGGHIVHEPELEAG